MSAARDRLLDVVLEEEIGGARPPDLSLRVLAAVRAQDSEAPPEAVPTARSPRWVWAATAAALLLGIGLGFFARGPREEAPLEVVSDVSLLTIDPSGPTRHGTHFVAGSVVHAGAEAARLSFPGGGVVVLQPGAFVRIGGTAEHPSLTYGSGRVAVHGGTVPLSIVLPAGTMQIASSTNGLLDRFDDPDGTVEPDDTVLWVANESASNVIALTR